jgi:hypothetical protein
MRHLAKALSAIVFATMASCAAVHTEDDGPPLDTDTGDTGGGAGASEDFSGGGDTGDGDTDDGGGGDTGGGEPTCPTDTTCDGGGDLPPPPPPTCDHDTDNDGHCDGDGGDQPPTCDHDNDGDCDSGDCDHDDDGDCDGDDGGDGHEENACTYTQGFWKNHPEDWPVSSLTLGTNTYTQAQLLAILGSETNGNGLLILAHQLIAAKLNIASGASSASIAGAIAEADAMIGDLVVGTDSLPPSSTSDLATELDEFNNTDEAGAQCD